MNVSAALHLAITLPFAAGLAALLIPRRLSAVTRGLTLVVAVLVLGAAIGLYRLAPLSAWQPEWAGGPLLGLDGLSALILLGAAFFCLVMAVYSVGFIRDEETGPQAYYANFLWVVGAVCATILARDLLVLVFFWALMGIPFYLLINMGTDDADAAAKKTLIILGGSDSLMILGVAIIYRITGSFDLWQQSALSTEGASLIACLCLAVAAFAKAGAMPFHSWLPDASRTAPVPAVALLPASLDKLLGIYLFARISMNLFAFTPAVRSLFVLLGAITVMAAVMMALVQHNLRRLLGFHAVSQVGYMVLGIATGTAIGVIGGLFHMFNNAIYKSCLFLTAGAAERRAGTGELDQMGGLARAMPLTFGAALIAALAISGVPPLNGFVSKWLVYQGIIEMKDKVGSLWVVALVAAMFGSALTLASFVKVLHSVFLGQPRRGPAGRGPTPNAFMHAAMAALAVLCLVFGIFAFSVPVNQLILRALPQSLQEGYHQPLAWQPGTATALLCVALVLGGVIYLLGTISKVREDEAYVGGEAGARAEPYRFSGVEFYRTVDKIPSLKILYRHAAQRWYDVYALCRRLLAWVARPLQVLHSGLLLSYVAWCVLGLVVLLWVLVKFAS